MGCPPPSCGQSQSQKTTPGSMEVRMAEDVCIGSAPGIVVALPVRLSEVGMWAAACASKSATSGTVQGYGGEWSLPRTLALLKLLSGPPHQIWAQEQVQATHGQHLGPLDHRGVGKVRDRLIRHLFGMPGDP